MAHSVLGPTYHFLTDDSLQSADKDQQKSRAVAGKPRTIIPMYVSKFSAASRGSPCDSAAFLFCNRSDHYGL